MTEYTPDTQDVRHAWSLFWHASIDSYKTLDQYEAEFDRWLAQVKADALREIAHDLARECEFDVYPTCPKCIAQSRLLLRAKEIEAGEARDG